MSTLRSHTRQREAVLQREQAAKRDPRLTPALTFVNASQKARYVPPTWNVRPGADEHLRVRSLG